MSLFRLQSEFKPAGDQPRAIQELVDGIHRNDQFQVLLGVTGSGKTFTMANVIQELSRPTLIITHNKTLAGQLYQEFKEFFPHNAVEYFVSYYDYYQPEAYVVHSDTFIEKDAGINDELDKLRMRTTTSLLTRKDVVVIASVSCIYGLGSPKEFAAMMVPLKVGQEIERDDILRALVDIQYSRNDVNLARSTFRVRGDIIEVHPSYEDFAYRIEMFGDEIEKLSRIHLLTGETEDNLEEITIAPAKHFVTREENMSRIVKDMEKELRQQLKKFQKEDKLVEAQRLESRTRYDIEMLEETGFCSGIENYSRIIEDRPIGSRPFTLLDFFGDDFLMFIDESHASVPQIGGMFAGDCSRKTTLVDYGFRLPCAIDNRPMNFEEFENNYAPATVFVSATPGDYELDKSDGVIVEQIIRPTGLLDPRIEIHPSKGQIDHLINEIKEATSRQNRVLVTTLTKKMSEDLTEFLLDANINVRYLHSDIDALERMDIIRGLRKGEFDVLIGINLLREGLDIPEVSLVCILDADKEGFLRSYRSLIQTMGRAARHKDGKVILFADHMTKALDKAIGETNRRRELQEAFNIQHNITPQSVKRKLEDDMRIKDPMDEEGETSKSKEVQAENLSIDEIEAKMHEAAANLDFEEAARLRDLLLDLKNKA